MLQKHQFKAKNSEIKDQALCLANISKDVTINNIKNGIRHGCKFFPVDLNPIDTNNILDIRKYLIKKTYIYNEWVNLENIYWIINWHSK